MLVGARDKGPYDSIRRYIELAQLGGGRAVFGEFMHLAFGGDRASTL